MLKILNCYLYAKKGVALCLRLQLFLANPVVNFLVMQLSYWQRSSRAELALYIHSYLRLSLHSLLFLIIYYLSIIIAWAFLIN